MDTLCHRDVGGAVIATIARAFERRELGKLAFPVAQDVLADAKLVGELADGEEGARLLSQRSCPA